MEKNDKLLLKDIKEDLNKWRFFLMFMDNIRRLEDTIIKMSSLLNLIYKSNEVQMKFPLNFFLFFRTWQAYSNINVEDLPCLKKKKKKHPEEEEELKQLWRGITRGKGWWGLFIEDMKIYYKVIVRQWGISPETEK